MAATYIRPYKTANGLSAVQTMRERFTYGLNPKKCAAVCAYLCDPETAHAEFMLVKNQYEAATGRPAERGHLFFQIRQSFPPGEITVEEAQQIGYETALRWTKNRHQFFVCTHTDKGHYHNHIYYNATAEDGTRKFHNFAGSSFHMRRLSDRVCLEHNLSVIANPKQHSKGPFKHYGKWQGKNQLTTYQARLKSAIDAALSKRPKDFDAFLAAMTAAGYTHKWGRGGVLSFRAEGQERFTRLRSSTLGDGYGIEDIRAVIAGRRRAAAGNARAGSGVSRKVNLMIDIQEKMRDGKGPAYERWATIYNLKQMAAALQYLQENNLLEYARLDQKAAQAVGRFQHLAGQIQKIEAAISVHSELMGAMVSYAKTRPVFDEYKAQKYSNKYLAEHENDIKAYRAAKATFTRLLNRAKLPRMDALKADMQRLASEKRALYAQYRAAQRDMREVVAVKGNIDHLLGITGKPQNKEQAR